MSTLPLLIQPEDLDNSISSENVLLVDVSNADTYKCLHIDTAVHIDYARIVTARKPVMGLVPDDESLAAVFSASGIDSSTHVVAYDDEGGGRAARLLWTLAVAGHFRGSLLNGGLHAWANEGRPCSSTPVVPVARRFVVRHDEGVCADHEYIYSHLGDPACCLLDARSPDEYHGLKKLADRAGHIPGAVNIEWTRAIDKTRNLRLKPDHILAEMYASAGITPDREVITYCQSHHRSAHTWLVLRHLGYENVRGFPGSWSYWGNQPELPVET